MAAHLFRSLHPSLPTGFLPLTHRPLCDTITNKKNHFFGGIKLKPKLTPARKSWEEERWKCKEHSCTNGRPAVRMGRKKSNLIYANGPFSIAKHAIRMREGPSVWGGAIPMDPGWGREKRMVVVICWSADATVVALTFRVQGCTTIAWPLTIQIVNIINRSGGRRRGMGAGFRGIFRDSPETLWAKV